MRCKSQKGRIMSETNSTIISLAHELGLAFVDHRLMIIKSQSDSAKMRGDVRNIGNDMRAVMVNK